MYTRKLIDTDQIVRFEAVPFNSNGGPGNDRVVYLDIPADEFKLVDTDDSGVYTYNLKTNKYTDEAKKMLKFGGGDFLYMKLSSQEQKNNSGKNYHEDSYGKKLYIYENNNMKIKLQDLTIDIIQQAFPDVFAKSYGHVSFPNASDSTTSVRSERDLANWKQGIMNVYGNVELEFNPEAENWWERVKVLDPKFQANKDKYINAKISWLDSERSSGRTSGLDEEMDSGDYIKFLMDKHYEYRLLAADPTLTKEATRLYLDKASEYYARAQEEIDKTSPDMTDHLSDEDKTLPNVPLSSRDQAMIDDYEEEEANREVPRDYASMYENETKNNKMENLDLNRWAKLAGINENEKIYRRDPRGNEEWEGSINGLGKEGHPRVFDRMGDIILANYPEEGNSTYRMEVYYNNDNEPTGANGGFAIEKGNVYFDFKFKGDQVVDFKFNEQNY
jgi:hypothetical protein